MRADAALAHRARRSTRRLLPFPSLSLPPFSHHSLAGHEPANSGFVRYSPWYLAINLALDAREMQKLRADVFRLSVVPTGRYAVEGEAAWSNSTDSSLGRWGPRPDA